MDGSVMSEETYGYRIDVNEGLNLEVRSVWRTK
jgi:hypothetical protein